MKTVKPINALKEQLSRWQRRRYEDLGDVDAKNKRGHVSYIPLDHFSLQEIVQVQRENERDKAKSELHTRWPAVIQQSLETRR